VKSLGAKTNHLPNIQGLTDDPGPIDGAGTKKFCGIRCLRPP
jgi:hypothetical protein